MSRLAWSWGGLLVWLAVCGAVSGRVWASVVGEPTNMLGALTLVSFTAFVLVARRHAIPVRHLIARYGWMAVLFESVLALGQRFLQGEALAAGTLSNSTNMGVMFVLLLPWMSSRDSADDRHGTWIRIATAILALAALVATESRVAAVVVFAWFAWAIASRFGASFSRSTRYGVVALTAVVVAGAVLGLGGGAGALWSSVLGERPAIYLQAVRAVAERPLVGWGPDGFLAGGAATSTPELASAGRTVVFRFGSVDPHNIVLWFAVSGGLFAVALFIWALVEFARRVRGAAAAGRDVAPGVWGIAGTLLVALTAPLVVHVLPLLAVVAGVALEPTSAVAAAPRTRITTRGAAVAAALLALAGVVLVGNAGTRAALEVASAERSPGVVATAVRASALWSVDAHLAYLASLHAGWASLSPASPYSGSNVDLEAIERAIALDLRNPIYALEHARTVRYHDRPASEVDAAFQEAFARYPLFPLAHAEYAAYLADDGRVGDARRELEIATLVEDGHLETVNAIRAATERIDAAESGRP